MLRRKKTVFFERFVDRVKHIIVRGRRRSRLDVGDNARGVVVACLGKMDLLTDPLDVTLSAVTRIRIVWGMDHFSGGGAFRKFFVFKPTNFTVMIGILFAPNRAEELNGGHFTQPRV